MAEKPERNMDIFQNLMDAGCSTDFTEQFFQLQIQGKDGEQLDLLSNHRQALLDKIHDTQKCLDCLDYLIYQMRKKNRTN